MLHLSQGGAGAGGPEGVDGIASKELDVFHGGALVRRVGKLQRHVVQAKHVLEERVKS